MDNNIKSVKKWYKNKKLWFFGGIVIGVAVWAIFFRGGQALKYETIVASRGELIQEVSVTGKIKPAQSVDLQFENSGRIALINYKVGDRVSAGVTIATLENQELQAQILEKEASLQSAEADLNKTIKNLDSFSDSSIATSLRIDLENAEVNLINIKKKADDELVAKYSDGFSAVNEAMIKANASFTVLKNMRTTYFNGLSSEDLRVKVAEELANVELYGLDVYNRLGADDYVKKVNQEKTNDNIDTALDKILAGLTELKNAYLILQSEMLADITGTSSADRDKVSSEAGAISIELTSISSAIQNIETQKITNSRNISDAQASLAKAKAAFPTAEDVAQKEAVVKQAEASLLAIRSQLRKSLVVAPFAGIIGKIGVERGQTVNSSDIIVSLISANNYQIEANITEIDIGKVGIGNLVHLTLDAYGYQRVFNASVSVIDTSATIVEGVTTYKTVLDFSDQISEGIRPNMTANIDIQTAKKEDVISIPQRAVISRNGSKIIRIYHENNMLPEERIVQLGMSGKDGYIEVISGLVEGENIITFINE